MDMIMALRNAARSRMGNPDAARRRLGRNQNSQRMGTGTNPETGELADGQTPEDIMLADMQEMLDAEVEPPEITNTAADTMMRYGAIQDYLMRAKGELPNG